MRYPRGIGFLAILATLIWQHDATAAVSGLTRVASGLSAPIYMTYAPGDRNRLFIVERGSPSGSAAATASIKILNMNTGQVNATPFLTISGINNNGEGGLLGLAFDPNYQTNGKFYVNLTASDSDPNTYFSGYVRQYTVSANPDIANNTTFNDVISWGKPQNNHNGGWIGFSPNDGLLYIGIGDGGGSFDSGTGHNATIGNGQDKTVLLGKMLRIDPSGDDFPGDSTKNYKIPASNPFAGAIAGADEIWSYGLRNPFRNSFDRATGDLWIGDVGQGEREEIDKQLSGVGGANFGWRLREGDVQTPSVGGAVPSDYKPPEYSYTHPGTSVPPASPAGYTGTVVTGGYVYRGPDPSLQGKYFFFDSQNTNSAADDSYWMFNTANPAGTVANINSLLTADMGSHLFPASFGEDAAGNLYIAYIGSGEVYRVATAHIAGDYDYDGDVDNSDYGIWRLTLGDAVTTAPADGSGNGVVDAADYVIWRKNLGRSLGSGSGAEAVPEAGLFLYLMQAASVLAIQSLFSRRRTSAKIMGSLS